MIPKIIKGLAIPAVSAIFGGLVALQVNKFQTRVQYLDFGVDSSNILDSSTQKLPSDKLKIFFDNDSKNPVNKISQIKVYIYNFSDQDYENVSFYIEIAPKSISNKGLKIIPTQAIAVSPENVEKLSQISSPSNLKGQRYGYKIKILNRTEKLEQPAFKAIYTIIGEKAENIVVKPELVVKSLKARVYADENFREYVYENLLAQNNWLYYLIIKFPWIISMAILMTYLVLYWLMEVQYKRFNYIKSENKRINSLKQIFIQQGEMAKLKQQQTERAMAEYLIGTYFAFYYKNCNQEFLEYLTNNFLQTGEMNKLKQQTSESAMADSIVNYLHQFRLKVTDQEALSYLIDKLYQQGEMDKLKQTSDPSFVADYIVKTYREVAWKNIPWWRRWRSEIPKP